MGESSRQNLWKRNRRSTCERGNSKPLRNMQQDTKKRYKKGYPESKHKKMAEPVGGNNESSDYERIFFKCGEKTGSESKLKSKCNHNHDRL